MKTGGWNLVDADVPLLTYTYSFGPGLATALAVGVDGGLAVVSPPCNVPDDAYASLEKHGAVKALVASNAYHHMGLAPWKKRFPDAVVYAPAQAVGRVQKQSGLAGIKPLADMPRASNGTELVDMPHWKTGEVLVRAPGKGGKPVWYVTDVVMNLPRLPPGLFGLLFKVLKTAPGIRFNKMASLFMMKDAAAVKRWLLDEATKAPPSRVLVCHGDHFDVSPDLRELRAALG
jgi:hypothetical protein